MAVTGHVGTLGVVPVLLAALDVVVGRREVGQHAGGVLVGRILQVPPLQDAHRGHPEVFDAGIELQALVGPLLLLVVVDVGVAGVPALVSQTRPALQLHVDGHSALSGGFQVDARRRIPPCLARPQRESSPWSRPPQSPRPSRRRTRPGRPSVWASGGCTNAPVESDTCTLADTVSPVAAS